MAPDGSVIIEILGDDNKLKSTLSGLGKTAATALKGVATAVGAATTATAAAVASVGKQAVEAYADYEQLVGGVETLFKDSAGIVEEYASNAYKTAGISANAYMETVTSFSASLLQSLDGDTRAAAEAADMAITDMADNANKMGTSMESIQNAYQGFAKQNYTMLDNLKLGYGGTKEEMERLLEDAEKLSGIHYDISSLNDVYNAIHVIQTEMGITGTTAEEASSTIQGSIASAKAAYENFLVGLADENQDIGVLMDDLIESIGTAWSNLAPRVEVVMDSLLQVISEGIPKLAEEFGPKLGAALQASLEYLPNLIDAGTSMLETILSGITENADQISNGAIAAVEAFAGGIANILPMLGESAWEIVQSLGQYIVENGSEMVKSAVSTLTNWIEGFSEHLPDILLLALAIMGALLQGLIESIPIMLESIPEIVNGLWDAFTSVDWLEFGTYIIQGIADGIAAAVGGLIDAAISAAKSALDSVKDFLGIHSPSTKYRDEVGEQIPPGIGEGVKAKMPALNQQVRNELDGLMEQAKEAAQTESQAVGAGIGARSQPVPNGEERQGGSETQGAWGTRNPIVIKFDGELAQLIRVLRPYIDEEDNRRGPDPARGA